MKRKKPIGGIRDRAKPADPSTDSVQPTWHESIVIDGKPYRTGGSTEEARLDLLQNGHHMTELEFGAWVARWYQKGFRIDGCTAGMLALHFQTIYLRDQASQAIARGECCGQTPDDKGHCFYCFELCPLVRTAGKIIREESGE